MASESHRVQHGKAPSSPSHRTGLRGEPTRSRSHTCRQRRRLLRASRCKAGRLRLHSWRGGPPELWGSEPAPISPSHSRPRSCVRDQACPLQPHTSCVPTGAACFRLPSPTSRALSVGLRGKAVLGSTSAPTPGGSSSRLGARSPGRRLPAAEPSGSHPRRRGKEQVPGHPCSLAPFSTAEDSLAPGTRPGTSVFSPFAAGHVGKRRRPQPPTGPRTRVSQGRCTTTPRMPRASPGAYVGHAL